MLTDETYLTVFDAAELKVVYDPDDVDGLPYGFDIGRGAETWLTTKEITDLIAGLQSHVGAAACCGGTTCSPANEIESLVDHAIEWGKTIKFGYAKGKGGIIETRRLTPEKIMRVGDHSTVVGIDPDRDGPRAYRMDRMKGDPRLV